MLGLSLAIAPVGGYLAVTGQWSEPWWLLLALALAVATWVAGFDILYALQDEAFDRAEGLRSAVVRLGEPRAILARQAAARDHHPGAGAVRLWQWASGSGTTPAWRAAAALLPTSISLVRRATSRGSTPHSSP